MPLERWYRPKPKQLTGLELAAEVARRQRARGLNPTRMYVDPLEEADVCASGCHPSTLMRVVAGPALVGSLVCVECAAVYRKEMP